MASSSLPAPGTTFGPCETKCQHTDCAETRAWAKSTCRLCEKAIGYDQQFYHDPMTEEGFVHAECLEELAEVNKQRPVLTP